MIRDLSGLGSVERVFESINEAPVDSAVVAGIRVLRREMQNPAPPPKHSVDVDQGDCRRPWL